MPARPAAAQDRIAWIDIAKASAIILVVLYHVGYAGIGYVIPDSESQIIDWWARFNRSLVPVRMPLFFLASGILAASSLSRPWPRVWRSRQRNLLWTYLLWGMLFAAIAGFAYNPQDPVGYMRQSLAALPVGGTAYWFLFVLVVFLALARLLQRWRGLTLVLTFGLLWIGPWVGSIAVPAFMDPLSTTLVRLCSFGFWFFLGCFQSGAIVALAETLRHPSRRQLAGALFVLPAAGYSALAYAVYWNSLDGAYVVPMSFLGMSAAFSASVWAARFTGIARWAGHIAARTLPIYLLHPVLLAAVVVVVRALGGGESSLPPDNLVLNLIAVPVLTTLGVVSALSLYTHTRTSRFRWIFAFPARRSAGEPTGRKDLHRYESA